MTASELVTRLSMIWDQLDEGELFEARDELEALMEEVEQLREQ